MAGDLSNDLASLRIERGGSTPPSDKRPLLWWALGIGLTALVLVLVGSLLWSKLTRPAVRLGEVSAISPAQADVKLMTTGYVVPLRRAIVATKIVAPVESIEVREGQDIKEGQLIAKLQASDVRAAAAEGRAALRTAEARLAASKASLAQAKRDVDRERALFDKAATTRAAFDSAQSAFDVAQANLQAAEAELATAQARLDNAESLYADTRITAPFSGRIVRKLVEMGEVPVSASGSPGGIVELVDFGSLVVEADVSEGRIAQVKLGGPAEITLDAYPTRRMRGEVTEIRPTVDRQKATVLVRVKFKDDVDGVLPQMAAKVLLLEQEQTPESLREPAKIVVPQSAVVQDGEAAFVFVVSEGKVRMTPVKLGAALGERREITQGPRPGTKIVVDPPASLADGDAIKEKV